MRRFVVIGQRASADAGFSLNDLPSSSGRLDALLGCLRAGLLVSHGVRQDTQVFLVLGGGPRAPRTLRFDGATARFVRPDERALATLVQKALAAEAHGPAFVEVRPGIAVADGGIVELLATLGPSTPFLLDEHGADARTLRDFGSDPLFFVGDHSGFDPATLGTIASSGATPISVGPRSLHAEYAVALIANELDRREAALAPAK